MQKTSNLGLNIIEANDQFNFECLNENFQKLDVPTSSFPSGGIIIWSGSETNIPSGWVICDGNNGTPDLRGRFILGSSNSHTIGSVGGEETHILTVNEMPRHIHSINVGTGRTLRGTAMGDNTSNYSASNKSSNTSYTGNTQAHNNMPPYYVLCFIMKV